MIPNEKTVIGLEVGKRIVVGRSGECDFVDNHCYVSREHAALELYDDGRVKLTDLESSNGTFYRIDGGSFKRLDSGASDWLDGGMNTCVDICLGGIESRYYRLSGNTLKRGGGLEIRFDHVKIRSRKPRKSFLDDDGTTVIPQGSFTVVIGTSGSGKSLLMNAVADTLNSGYRVEGDISLKPVQKDGSRKGGVRYVPQDDAVPLELTVGQVMQFAAELRLPEKSLTERNDTINDVLRQVDLSVMNGVKISKLSGGQRKRVSVAVDLLDYPQLLILDEPTSGLDAETELRLIELLKNISRQEGITVVCITHSLTACELADNIVVVGKKPGSETSCIRFSGSRDEIIKDAGVKERMALPFVLLRRIGHGGTYLVTRPEEIGLDFSPSLA